MEQKYKRFLEEHKLKPGDVFFADVLPCYACYISRYGELFVFKPEWEEYKLADDMWLDYIIDHGQTIWRAIE